MAGGDRDRGDLDPPGHLEALLGRSVDRAAVRARRRARFDELVGAETLLPGAGDDLEDGGRIGLGLGLATRFGSDSLHGLLARVGLAGRFGSVRCREDVPRVKPEPDPYPHVLEDLEVRPEEAVALEDSPNGITAARRAGILLRRHRTDSPGGSASGTRTWRLNSLADDPLSRLLEQIARPGR